MPYVTLRRRAAATIAAAVLAAVALAGPAAAATAPVSNAPSPYLPGHGPASDPTAQGLIMKDGNICDPIRHMGC
jgi:Spy/CpxP family protein refolding chaperone